MKLILISFLILFQSSLLAQPKTISNLKMIDFLKNPSNDPGCKVIKTAKNNYQRLSSKEENHFKNFQEKIKNHDAPKFIDYLLANNKCKDEELIQEFSKLEEPSKRELIRSLSFKACDRLEEIPNFLELIQTYDSAKLEDRYWLQIVVFQKLEGYQEVFDNSLNPNITNAISQSGLGKFVKSLSVTNDTELKKKGFDYLLNLEIERKYLNPYTLQNILIQFLRYHQTEEYGVKNALRLINLDLSDFGNTNLYWDRLMLELYDHLPAEDWCQLMENQKIINYEYSKHTEIEFAQLYSEIKGMESFELYESLLIRDKIELEEIPMDYYLTLGYAFIGIRAVLESGQLTKDDRHYIREVLDKNAIEKISGYLKPHVVTLYYLTGISEEDFHKKPMTPEDRNYFSKLQRVQKFDNQSLFKSLVKHNITKETKAKAHFFVSSYVDNCFPNNDTQLRGLLENVGKTISDDAEYGRIPIPYGQIFNQYLDPIKDILPFYEIEHSYQKQDKGYNYTLSLLINDIVYTVSPNDYGDYFDPTAIKNLINMVLSEQATEVRLIELETDDQSTFSVYMNPDVLVNLYNDFELTLEIL